VDESEEEDANSKQPENDFDVLSSSDDEDDSTDDGSVGGT
jgi:hypothetical protein